MWHGASSSLNTIWRATFIFHTLRRVGSNHGSCFRRNRFKYPCRTVAQIRPRYLDAPCQLSPPLKASSPTQVRQAINQLNPKKVSGYDLLYGTVLKNLPRQAIVLLTTIFNSMLRLCYFPVKWKYAQIIMITKPGKQPTEASSYGPISPLPIMSKVFDRILLRRLDETIHIDGLLPLHQFGFRNNHSTIQQCHRVVNKIKESIEGKKMCTSVFLDIEQDFDKV